jgi:hypothetical protein
MYRVVGALEDKIGNVAGGYRSLHRRHDNFCSWIWNCSVLRKIHLRYGYDFSGHFIRQEATSLPH